MPITTSYGCERPGVALGWAAAKLFAMPPERLSGILPDVARLPQVLRDPQKRGEYHRRCGYVGSGAETSR